MGKRGNKNRAMTRRGAAAAAQAYLQRKIDGVDQEDIEMQRAYSSAMNDGEFNDDSITVTEPGQLLLASPETEVKNILSLRDRWRTIVMEDHLLEYPDLCLEVYVNDSVFAEPPFAEWMMRGGCRRAETLETADLCVFTGGADVDPIYYGALAHKTTKPSPQRDAADLEAYKFCYDNGIPMFGICRGAQFLHVMNGGKLYQDIDGHVGDHPIVDLESKRVIDRVSSVHHQSCIQNINGGQKILATARVSDHRDKFDVGLQGFVTEVGPKPDIEAFVYPETLCVGVQGHPEYRTYHAYSIYCLNLIQRWVIENPDVDFGGPGSIYRRLKPDVLAMREMANKETA